MPGIGSVPCPKPDTRFDRAKAKSRTKMATWLEVCAAVTLRDGSSCRVCGKFCNPRAVGVLYKAHHHHIVYRSRGGEDTTSNVCLLCPDCHNDEHKGKFQLSGDADQRDPISQRLNGVCVQKPGENGLEVIAWT